MSKVIIDGVEYVAKRTKVKHPVATINGVEYKSIGWGYTDDENRKFKVLILWLDGSMMIHKEMMTLKEIEDTQWNMGTQAFAICRDALEEKQKESKNQIGKEHS